MQAEEIITKITRFFPRADGSVVRIVAENYGLPGTTPIVGYYVHRRQSPEHNWVLCNDRPDPRWREMPVEEYVRHGRAEVFQVLSHGEILQTLNAIGKPMSFVEGW